MPSGCLRNSPLKAGVTPALSGNFRRQPDGTYLLEYDFVMQPGPSRVPRAPIP